MRILFENVSEVVTNRDLVAQSESSDRSSGELLSRVRNGWLAVENGKVASSGTASPPPEYQNWQRQDLGGGLVLPGFVDAHTHPTFAGDRSHEFASRLSGETYQSIAAKGGGIQYTVQQTRDASLESLTASTKTNFDRFLRGGVTTVEAKSGYGLTVEDELKQLRAISQAAKESPLEVKSTCLALHAIPPDAKSKEDFVQTMTNELLPEVVKESLADYVDAFIESGYFSVADTEPFVAKAKELGFGVRIHADEFTDCGAAMAAARWQAASADHLECTKIDAAQAMAEAGTTAVLLPGTSVYTKIPYVQAKTFREAGCAMAIATDFNPGSCRIWNLALLAGIGAIHCGLTLAETVAAITYVPACSLGLGDRKGALATGFDADFLHFRDYESVEAWLADCGQIPPSSVYIGGNKVV